MIPLFFFTGACGMSWLLLLLPGTSTVDRDGLFAVIVVVDPGGLFVVVVVVRGGFVVVLFTPL